jgi:hypothetical protein
MANGRFGFLTNIKFLFWIYTLTTLAVSIHKYFIGTINNFLIFRTSFYNLIALNDLYALYPQFHYDHYKYSPAFALLMAPIAALPEFLGVIVWNLINVLPLYFAVCLLSLPAKKKTLILWIILIELVTSIQNTQSNGLYAALFVLTFVLLENRKNFWAALMVVLSAYIKIFGGIAIVLFIIYPDRLKSMLYLLFWFIVLALLPLLVIPLDQLVFLYGSWYELLTRDVANLYGLSVMGILQEWFGVKLSNTLIMIIGLALLLIPLLKSANFKSREFRYLFLSSLLIWSIIFNHKAESPMFVIAVTGVAIWYVMQKPGLWANLLLGLTLVLTSISVTEITPVYLRKNIIQPYLLKVVPCILVWVRVFWEMIRRTDN